VVRDHGSVVQGLQRYDRNVSNSELTFQRRPLLRAAGALAILSWLATYNAIGMPGARRASAQSPLGVSQPPPPRGVGGVERYGPVPGPPHTPIPASRPAGWPARQHRAINVAPHDAGTSAADEPLLAASATELEGATIIARIGSDVILASEVLGQVNEVMTRNADRIPDDQEEEVRRMLMQQRLESLLDTKLLYADARRKIPAEGFPQVQERVAAEFDEGDKNELSKMLKRAGLQTRVQLDAKLRSMGSSLEREKQAFIERKIATAWLHQQLKLDDEITHHEMLEYYRNHQADFEFPDQVRWKQLLVRFERYPSREAAHRKLAELGNRLLDGEPFAEVAKAHSDGPTAADGGEYDWTNRESVVSKTLWRALFELPIGRLSPILEDHLGLHIVRVDERRLAGRVSFAEAQSDIRDKIRAERFKRESGKYLARLRERTPVWTIFDGSLAADQVTAGRPSANDPTKR